MELIVERHPIEKGRQRISRLKEYSNEEIADWYQENVPFAKRVPWGSRLHLNLDKTYGKRIRRSEQKMIYLRDNFGIYIIEPINEFKWFLHSVQRLGFGGSLIVKLIESLDEEKLANLINFRDALRRSRQTSEEIEDLIA